MKLVISGFKFIGLTVLSFYAVFTLVCRVFIIIIIIIIIILLSRVFNSSVSW